jgi:hypothetical protein
MCRRLMRIRRCISGCEVGSWRGRVEVVNLLFTRCLRAGMEKKEVYHDFVT